MDTKKDVRTGGSIVIWFLKTVGIVVILVVMSFVIGFFLSSTAKRKISELIFTATSKEFESMDKFTLLPEWGFKLSEYGIRMIEGKVRNNTDKVYSYVEIDFNLYDRDGNQVGSTMAYVTNLEANGVWRFRAAVFDVNVVKAKCVDIKGY
ncbi:MAG: FxLYD domain-containing protein [Endomicrobiales bacterium]|nr:FxLYD domain-containing protein [Endomicrobiales bacterium]